ncbi:hypothetical protein P5673_009213 [Acropora cervicornis]|uniref:Uncharacterized protein n=1 Tax=Acropora cervicornis TaxID=6130 RepID=A0AAD9V9U2_ACRCE|nr:hypothetical protein P5673_009213 [Acropora cervicornis]
MFPGASSTGFYHAPISKGLLALTGTASLINILFSSSTKNFLPNFTWSQLIRNTKEIWIKKICAVGLQLTAVSALKHFGHPVGIPPPGPYLLIFIFIYLFIFNLTTITK